MQRTKNKDYNTVTSHTITKRNLTFYGKAQLDKNFHIVPVFRERNRELTAGFRV